MVNTSPSKAESAGLIAGQGAETPHMLQGQNNQNINNRSNIVTNTVKTLKMVHIFKTL